MRLKLVFKSIYKKIFPDRTHYLKKELSGCHSVLDLGCGVGSIQYCNVPFSVGVEIFEPCIKEGKKRKILNQYIKADIRKVEFKPNSFDAVIALDVIEHLTKEEGYRLIKNMERWARKKIIVFTPNGYVQWGGCDGNPFQEHKSGWQTEEFRNLGFRVCGINGLKYLWGELSILKYKPKFLWMRILDLSQKITYYYPKIAYYLLAIKELEISKNKVF